MPGPGFLPGAALPSRHAPPKPVPSPWLSVPDIPQAGPTALPPTVTRVFRALWHAIGTDLPFSINNSRASRRGMRAFVATHGR